MGVRNTSKIVVKGGKKRTMTPAAPAVVMENKPSPVTSVQSVDVFAGKILNEGYDFDVSSPDSFYNILSDLEPLDVAHLLQNHDNDYPLWKEGRDDKNMERLEGAGLIKINKKEVEKTKLTKKGENLAKKLKEGHILPIGVYSVEKGPYSTKDIYSASLVKYDYRGIPVISNSHYANKWKFNLFEIGSDISNPNDEGIYSVLDIKGNFDKKTKKFKDALLDGLDESQKANLSVVPVGYQEGPHQKVLYTEYNDIPVYVEVPNNYINYLQEKHGSGLEFLINSDDISKENQTGMLGYDVQVTVKKKDAIVAFMKNGFYISSPSQIDTLNKQLKDIYK